MENEQQDGVVIAKQLDRLVRHLESLRIADYMELLQKPWRLIMVNLIAGLARGLGIAIGASLIFALTLEMLRRLIMLNIPGIGQFIATLVYIVEAQARQF